MRYLVSERFTTEDTEKPTNEQKRKRAFVLADRLRSLGRRSLHRQERKVIG